MPDSVQVRPAVPADAPAIAALTAELDYPASVQAIRSRLDEILARPEGAVFVAAAGSDPVGWVHVLRVLYLEAEPFAEIGGLVVTEGCRKRGAGRRLMAAAEGWAVEQGLGIVRLRSNVVRAGAHAFYRRLGYEIAKTQHTLVKQIGPAEDGPAA